VANDAFGVIGQVVSREDLSVLKRAAKEVNVDDAILKYILNIVFATRNPEEFGIPEIGNYIEYGASPRASINIYKAVKAVAVLRGKDFVTPVDVAEVVGNVLRHRIILNYKAEANGITADYIVKTIMQHIKLP
jgi:MoxR-like ATPase